MNKFLAAAALGSALIAGPAFPQDGPRPPRPDPLALADADKDGNVTKDEMLAAVAARFKKSDANGDGKVTAEERAAERAAIRRARMAKRAGDTDGDGAISLAEQQARAAKRFDWVDANKDGRIDQAERAAVRDKMMAMRGHGRHGGHRGPPPPADGPGAPQGD